LILSLLTHIYYSDEGAQNGSHSQIQRSGRSIFIPLFLTPITAKVRHGRGTVQALKKILKINRHAYYTYKEASIISIGT
jgi:hypothetical protein